MITLKALQDSLSKNHDLHIMLPVPASLAHLHIMLPDGTFVPEHFHITEIGKVKKEFIDCGGTRRSKNTCVLQVWVANDIDHRLTSSKLARILELAEPLFEEDLPIEIEYGTEAVSQYSLIDIKPNRFSELVLVLGNKYTECLAPDKCGVTGCCH